MKINPNVAAGSTGIQSTETKKTDKTRLSGYEKTEGSSSTLKNESSKSEISSRAKDMAKAKQIAADTPDVREAKIAALREQINNLLRKPYGIALCRNVGILLVKHSLVNI